ncbi:hypothetical protein L1049_001934 [Liquidambar formosana]|uniref:Uncharacterized protein n=1 Tax=Liquidambar formosana TaxID=63359 RepID=A0AAP0R8K1_LIQFO
MLRFDGGEEVFFDSVDCLSSEDSAVREDIVVSQLDYEIWRNVPGSVQERRESFLRGMGFVEFTPKHHEMTLERITDSSGAVPSSWASPINRADENLMYSRREVDGEANTMVDELEQHHSDRVDLQFEGETTGLSPSVEEFRYKEAQGLVEECRNYDVDKKKMTSWWRRFLKKKMGKGGICVPKPSEVSEPIPKTPKINRMKVQQNKKRCMEFTAVYIGQEFQAHKGFIWTMKFSPDGQYLASGGEDGVVRIWHVTSADASCKYSNAEGNFGSKSKEGKSSLGRRKSSHASVVIPDKIFQIEESPMQEFRGHSSDVLDLAWSKSNCLLSSSKDKTVRLWQAGCNECLNVFHHNNYVTCIQFNPVDDNYFISGSIDGKARIWGVSEGRVVEWADVRDVVTAICYQPDGNGFIVGSIAGTCRFYVSSGNHLQLHAQIHIQGKKKTSGNKITGIQFSHGQSQRVMITSEDSKVRIFDGIDIVHKYRGLRKSGSQMSASFTSAGRHIISVGEDSRVYVWNYGGGSCFPSSKETKSVRSCEHFFFEGVSVAIPWSGMETEQKIFPNQLEAATRIRESERFSLGSWFSMDGSCRGSATWPEEKLPTWDVPFEEHDHHQPQHLSNNHKHAALSETWGLVIVTASWDGTIRTFHNYGLPVRL